MLFDSIGKVIFGLHQNKLAGDIHPEYTPYQESPYAKKELGLAESLFNGRMFGAQDLERNIFANNSNYNATVQRNATDSGQALALGEQAMGQTNSALQNLQTAEKQNKYDLMGNLNSAYRTMIGEGDKVYQDKFQKYQIDENQQSGLRNAAWQNIFGGISDFESGGLQAGQALAGNPTGGMSNSGGGGSKFSSVPSQTDEAGNPTGGGFDISKLMPLLMMGV